MRQVTQLKPLIEELLVEIRRYGIKEVSMEQYQTVCNRILKQSTREGAEVYSHELMHKFLKTEEMRCTNKEICPEYLRFQKRVVRMLNSLADTGKVRTQWMTMQFHHCWKASGLIKHGNPRPYDLRHAFASRNLMRWIDNGNDITALLPFLSTYMGHSEIKSTLYCVHLLPERIRKSSGIDWTRLLNIYGEEGVTVEK